MTIKTTIRCSKQIKEWVKESNRTQVSIVSESIILYTNIYLFVKPYIPKLIGTDYSCTMRPVLTDEHYTLITELSDKKDSKHYNAHIRNAIYTYRIMFDDLKIYNLLEVNNIEEENSLLELLYDLSIVDKQTHSIPCLFQLSQ